ncbi:unnamed protein product [Cochlearia groenlandica]
MSRRACKRVSFSPPDPPEPNQEHIYSTNINGHNSSRHGRRRRVVVGIFRGSPSARRLLRRIGTSVVKTLRFMSFERKSRSNAKTTPRNVSSSSFFSCSSSSSSSSTIYMVKSKSLNESESHRAEAIEDCIKFLNSSSSSMLRSNSISSWSC